MAAAVSFDEVLNRTLEHEAPVAAPVHGGSARVATATAFGFFQLGRGEEGRLAHVRPTSPAGRVAPRYRIGPLAEPAADAPRQAATQHPRRTMRLTPDQHVALGDLRALGTPLRADFTRDELRSAFRALARRFHPDRHPGASDAVRTELSMLFRRLRSAYTILSRA